MQIKELCRCFFARRGGGRSGRFLWWAIVLTGLVACGPQTGSAAANWPATTGAPRAGQIAIRRLENTGFTVGYDDVHGRAAWVAYHLRPLTHFTPMPRPEFEPDPRLHDAGPDAIYARPDYDRGHLAPNYAISQLYGERAQQQTFYYSNIAPQRPRLNQLLWQRLEEIEIDDISQRTHSLWVLVGPIFAAGRKVPVAFFRIWLARGSDGDWHALAFRVPQDVRGDERLDRFLVSVDALERQTRLDFFAGLAPSLQRTLEARPAPSATFGFTEFACGPARYRNRWQNRDGVHLRYDRC